MNCILCRHLVIDNKDNPNKLECAILKKEILNLGAGFGVETLAGVILIADCPGAEMAETVLKGLKPGANEPAEETPAKAQEPAGKALGTASGAGEQTELTL